MNRKQDEQYVCLVCGFNMIGHHPDNCPFCGADSKNFITSEECSKKYRVVEAAVNDKVFRLNSVPKLGLEHAAYRIKTDKKVYWIDCPSSYDKTLEPADIIMFTHHHFLGASNLYGKLFNAPIRIHRKDSKHEICRPFTFNELFDENFTEDGIEGFHINGHTPGFTFYIFEDTLLICDYVFLRDGGLIFNPFGPGSATREGGFAIKDIIEKRVINKVCGFNYVTDYPEWKEKFDLLLEKS